MPLLLPLISLFRTSSCNGVTTPGLCPGDSSIQCCHTHVAEFGSCTVGSSIAAPQNGVCISTRGCSVLKQGESVRGFCPGGKDIQCCLNNQRPPNPPPRRPSDESSSSSAKEQCGPTCHKGLDVSTYVSSSAARCLVKDYSFIIVRGYRSNGEIDSNMKNTVKNCRNAGFKAVHIYMFPCPRCRDSAYTQMTELLDYLRKNDVKYGRIWIDVEQSSRFWGSESSNRKFLADLIRAAGSAPLGIYANYNTWHETFGSDFHIAQTLPLWYPRYDSAGASERDFRSFGGWTGAIAKQVCLRLFMGV